MAEKTRKYSDLKIEDIEIEEMSDAEVSTETEKSKKRKVKVLKDSQSKDKKKDSKKEKENIAEDKAEKKAEKKAELKANIKKNAEAIKSTVENGAQINVLNKDFNISKNFFAILIIVIFCGIILVAGFLLTKDKISKYENDKKNGALGEVFPTAISYSDASYNYNMLVTFLEEKGLEYTDVIINKIVYARDEQHSVKGLIIYLESYKKFGGIIKLAVGIQNNGTINDYYVLDISDAKGLDLRIKDDSFRSQFIGKNVPEFIISDNPVEDGEVLEITGASDASLAIVNGLNASIYTLQFIDESMGGLLG